MSQAATPHQRVRYDPFVAEGSPVDPLRTNGSFGLPESNLPVTSSLK